MKRIILAVAVVATLGVAVAWACTMGPPVYECIGWNYDDEGNPTSCWSWSAQGSGSCAWLIHNMNGQCGCSEWQGGQLVEIPCPFAECTGNYKNLPQLDKVRPVPSSPRTTWSDVKRLYK